MKTLSLFLSGTLLGAMAYTVPVAAQAPVDDEGHLYLGLGLSSLALDSNRVPGVPTSSPGHTSKMIGAILGYQFNRRWAVDLNLGTDFTAETGTDQIIANGYYFLSDKKWRPYVSAGFSAFSVDNAVDDSTQQIQGGIGVAGDLSHNMELRVGYQLFKDLGGDESYTDKVLGLALHYHFRKPKMVAQAEPQVESVPAEVVDTYELLVEFDFDKSDIKSAFQPQFAEIAQVLRDNPDISMTIEGHTDWIGTEEYNQGLSERRANAVKAKFVEDYAISPSRIQTIGYGETRPIADNNTYEGRQRNRRAISVIVKAQIVE